MILEISYLLTYYMKRMFCQCASWIDIQFSCKLAQKSDAEINIVRASGQRRIKKEIQMEISTTWRKIKPRSKSDPE